MQKLCLVVVIGVIALWASAAWADILTPVQNKTNQSATVGAGGIFFNGDDNATPSSSQTEFVPTVNLAGLTDMLAWQVFYGFGSDATVWGGSADYIVASNFKKCFALPNTGTWWFGIGPSLIDVNGLYTDDAVPAAALDDTLFGGNLGFGYKMNEWGFNLYAHILDGQMAVQGAVMYNFNTTKKK
jgi:hypothetical protein